MLRSRLPLDGAIEGEKYLEWFGDLMAELQEEVAIAPRKLLQSSLIDQHLRYCECAEVQSIPAEHLYLPGESGYAVLD